MKMLPVLLCGFILGVVIVLLLEYLYIFGLPFGIEKQANAENQEFKSQFDAFNLPFVSFVVI